MKYIACLTSYPKRFNNLPRVIESLWAQTIPPEKVVLTLARKEYAAYCEKFPFGLNCDVLVIEKDVKVYKKFLYAMEKYASDPYSLFLCADDDYVYDNDVADTLLQGYNAEERPVSGNSYWHNGLKCHCGALSLVFPAMFSLWRKYEPCFEYFESSDMFYTMLAAENHFTYASAGDLLGEFAKPIKSAGRYTKKGQVQRTYVQVAKLFNWI